jgi:hypothetical protein
LRHRGDVGHLRHAIGMISVQEACLRYDLSIEEFLSWQRTVEQHGIPGLRATRVGI